MFSKLASALAGLAVAASLSSAHAGTLSYSGYSVLNSQTVTVADFALGVNEAAGSGQITLHVDGGNGTLSTWCIDIPDMLQQSGTFVTGGFLTGTFGQQVNALLSHVVPILGMNVDASSALQVAIWKAEYGSALAVSAPSAVTSLAQSFLANVDNGTWTADPTRAVATLRANGANQDQAYLTAVPEPATLAVLGTGLLGLLALRYRSRRSAQD